MQNLVIPLSIPPGKGGAASALWRYELATGTKENITNFGEVRRGKNGKMYVALANNQNLKEVSSPDGTVSVVNFQATNTSGEKLVGVLPLQPNRTFPETEDSLYVRELEKKVYSVNDHLSSTRILLTDRKLSTIAGGIPTAFTGEIVEYYNYAPGGFGQVGRKKQSATPFRFTYGSHERIDEVLGNENTVDMGDRWLDTRILRTPKADAKTHEYPDLSPYSFVANNPLIAIDPDGEKIIVVAKKGFLGIGRQTIEYIPGKGYKGDNQFVKDAWEALNALSIVDEELILKAVSTDEVVKITEQSLNKALTIGANYNSNKKIQWNSRVAAKHVKLDGSDNGTSAPYRILSHEIRHWMHKVEDPNNYYDRIDPGNPGNTNEVKNRWTDLEEKQTIEEENKITSVTGEPQRQSHNDAELFKSTGTTSTTPEMRYKKTTTGKDGVATTSDKDGNVVE